MEKRPIIFDFDGVIVASEPMRYKTYRDVFKQEYGVILPEEDLSICGRTPRANVAYFFEKYGLKGDVEALLMKRNKLIYEAFQKEENIIPIKGVIEFVKHLKSLGVRMAIASSGHIDHIVSILGFLGIKDYFEIIISGDMVHRGKPHPEVFIETAKRMNVKCEDCIVIEDSIKGLISAKAASMKAIALNHTFPDDELYFADMIATDFQNMTYSQVKDL